jgi:hypothetical protein
MAKASDRGDRRVTKENSVEETTRNSSQNRQQIAASAFDAKKQTDMRLKKISSTFSSPLALNRKNAKVSVAKPKRRAGVEAVPNRRAVCFAWRFSKVLI